MRLLAAAALATLLLTSCGAETPAPVMPTPAAPVIETPVMPETPVESTGTTTETTTVEMSGAVDTATGTEMTPSTTETPMN